MSEHTHLSITIGARKILSRGQPLTVFVQISVQSHPLIKHPTLLQATTSFHIIHLQLSNPH